MILKIYKNKSPDNKIGKDLELLEEYDGNLNNEVSMMDIKFTLQNIGLKNIKKMNYIFVVELGRYYFITNVNLISQSTIEIECKCDVLESFKSEILENEVVTKRQENYNNRYLNDDLFKIYQNPKYLIREFPKAFSGDTRLLVYIGS